MKNKTVSNYKFNNEKYKLLHEIIKDNVDGEVFERFENSYEIIFFVSGNAFLKTETDLVALDASDLIILPPNEKYSLVFSDEKESEYFAVCTSDALIDQILRNHFHSGIEIINLANFDVAKSCFDRISFYEKSRENIDNQYYEKLLLYLIAEIYINLAIIKSSNVLTEEVSQNPFLTRLVSYINSHLQTVSVKALATNFKVSTTYIYKVLKKTMGVSPKEYITNKRLSYARYLIENGESAWNTAFQCGYNDYSSFYRAYYKYFNTTPSEALPEDVEKNKDTDKK